MPLIETFKPQQDELTTSPWSLPHVTLDNYAGLITPQFLHYVLNSVITSVGAVILSTLLGSLAAYALARVPEPVNGVPLLLFVSGIGGPDLCRDHSNLSLLRDMGLYDTLLGLLLPYAARSCPSPSSS